MYMKKSCQYLRCEILKEQQWLPTIANKFLLWCCQDKLIPHGPWVGAASNAGLHKVHLDPAGQPGHGAVTVERVGPQGSVGHPDIRMLKSVTETRNYHHLNVVIQQFLSPWPMYPHVSYAIQVPEGAFRYEWNAVAMKGEETQLPQAEQWVSLHAAKLVVWYNPSEKK